MKYGHAGFTGTSRGVSYKRLKLFHAQLSKAGVHTLHHGDCVGADAQVHEIAKRLGLKIVVHPPDNPKLRAFCTGDEIKTEAPYLVRNRAIVDTCDILLAMPWDPKHEQLRSGTWSTVRYAHKRRKKVIII